MSVEAKVRMEKHGERADWLTLCLVAIYEYSLYLELWGCFVRLVKALLCHFQIAFGQLMLNIWCMVLSLEVLV